MADYTQPEFVEKRLRYFDGQFLKDQDFIDEQKYHIDRQRRSDRLFHPSGIIEGLTVTPGTDKATVTPGTALDHQGRTIVLAAKETIPLKESRGKTVILYMVYHEEGSDQAQEGSAGQTRFHEKPRFVLLEAGGTPPADSLPLASLAVAANGTVTVDGSIRHYAGLRVPDGQPDRLAWPSLQAQQPGQMTLQGSLTVTGALGIGTSTPNRSLTIQGPAGTYLNVKGNKGSHEILIGADNNGGVVSTMTNHDLQLRAGGNSTKMTIKANGNVGIGAPNPNAPLQVSGDIVAGRDTPGQKFIFHTRTNGNGDFLQITGDRANGSWDWTKGITFQRDTGNVGIGQTNPGELLEVKGRIKSGGLTIGPWPANSTNYVFFGTNALDQRQAGNYALLQDSRAPNLGRTYLNSPVDVRFRINNADKMVLNNSMLNVLGTLSAKEIRTTLHTASGTARKVLSKSNRWGNFPDLAKTFTLSQATVVLVYYQITMGGGNLHLVTRLLIDSGAPFTTRAITGNTVYASPSNLWIGRLGAGRHTIRVQYRTPVAGVNHPAGTDWHNRVLNILIFGS